MPLVKANHLFLVPLIVFSIPSAAFFQQQVLILLIVTLVGSAGMLTRTTKAATGASASLLLLVVWGKVASDIYGLPGPDTAILLFEFMIVIFLMEASAATLRFDIACTKLQGRNDETSAANRRQAIDWLRSQLFSLGKFAIATFLLSLSLVIVGGFVSISVNQVAISGVMVIVALLAIFVLLTYRREPETPRRRKS